MSRNDDLLRIVLATAFLCCGTGCSIGPDYSTPVSALPDTFAESDEIHQTSAVELANWWRRFDDPLLEDLVDGAIRANLNLKTAQARVREARGLLRISRSDFFPHLRTEGSFSRSKSSENARNSTSGGDVGGGDATGDTTTTFSSTPRNLYEAGFDATWEIDVFGGTRREVEAARSAYEAQVEDLRNTLISLLSEVASNYVILRGAQQELSITRENAKAQEETLQLQELRLTAGLTSELTVAQARAQLQSTLSRVPALEIPAHQALHRLAVLLGRHVQELDPRLLTIAPIPKDPHVVGVGLPSDLLRRRPDVRRAERLLQAATARIGIATADLFPRIELTGSYGVRSHTAGNMFASDSQFWSWGPSVSWQILNWQAVLANIDVQEAREEQSLLAYQESVLLAISEVEGGIVAYRKEGERHAALERSVAANRQALRLARELNDAGVIDFLNVLNAQQAVYQSEDELAQSARSVSLSLITLYKALGGGWEELV